MSRKRRILVVDDNSDLTAMCRSLLEQDGEFEVREEITGHRTLEVAHAFAPDLILLDRYMPTADGLAIAKDILQDPGLCDVPVVLMTASATQSEADRGIFWPLPVLIKPFWPGALLHCIRRFLPQEDSYESALN